MAKEPTVPPMRGPQYRACNNCIGSPHRGKVYDSGAKMWKKCPACKGKGRVILKNL